MCQLSLASPNYAVQPPLCQITSLEIELGKIVKLLEKSEQNIVRVTSQFQALDHDHSNYYSAEECLNHTQNPNYDYSPKSFI